MCVCVYFMVFLFLRFNALIIDPMEGLGHTKQTATTTNFYECSRLL